MALIVDRGVNRKVVFGTACQKPDGKWFEKNEKINFVYYIINCITSIIVNYAYVC